MATAYLRPSADISLNHDCSSGSTGYNLINEVTCDEDSTYISMSAYNDSSSKTSTFTCTGTITSGHRIVSAKAVIYSKITSSSASNSTIAVTVGTSTTTQSASSTEYAATNYTIDPSNITVSGTNVSASIIITSGLKSDSKNTYYQRISQVYIEVITEEAVQYTVTTSTLGTGTITATSPVYKGDSSIAKMYPGTDLYVAALTDNGSDVTGSIIYVNPAPETSVVSQAGGASYGFTQGSTYWVSTNTGVNKSAAVCQLNMVCEVAATLTFAVINYAEETYDYGIIGAVDQVLNTTYTKDSGTSWDGSSADRNKSTEQDVTISIPAGTHFIQLKYRKDDGTSSNNDNFQWRIKSFTYNTTVQGYYKYTISNIQANHSLVCTFSDYSGSTFTWIKLNGTWQKCKSLWIKQNGTWVRQSTPPTGYTFIERKHNPWTFDKSFRKESIVDDTTWLISDYIAVTPDVELIVTGQGGDTNNTMWQAYYADKTYYDYWGGSGTVITTIGGRSVYQRTLSAANMANTHWVRVGAFKEAWNYIKVQQNGVTLFDGSLYPYN